MKRASVAVISVIVLVVFAAYASGTTPDASKLVRTVLVGNTTENPVPTIAQGTTLVDGTVALAEGTVVGINPSANTVQIANSVQLANSPSNPIFVQAAAAATSRPTPFQQTVSIRTGVGGVGFAEFIVPAAGTLVVENVSAEASDLAPTVGKIETTVNGVVAAHFLRSFDRFTVSESRRFYADGGSVVRIGFNLGSTTASPRDYKVTVSGFIE